MINSRYAARWGAISVILVACVGCDQWTKHVAIGQLKDRPPHSYCGDMFRLEYAENPGAFLGLGGQMPEAARWVVLIAFNSLLAAGIAAALVLGQRTTLARNAAFALLLAGAIGNLIDRVRFDGHVIDFLNLGLGPLRTGIFNVADVAISTGAVLLVMPALVPGRAQPVPPSPTGDA